MVLGIRDALMVLGIHRGTASMTRKLSAAEADARRCSARAKGTGRRCRRWALAGYAVCMMHGAGTRKRLGTPPSDGRLRKAPSTVALRHGRNTSRSPRSVGEIPEGLADCIEPRDLRPIAARLWVLLERVDELVYDDDPRVSLIGVGMCTRVLGQLSRLAALHDRQRRVGAVHVEREQVVLLVATILDWVAELAVDERVARKDLSARLRGRLERLAYHLGVDPA